MKASDSQDKGRVHIKWAWEGGEFKKHEERVFK